MSQTMSANWRVRTRFAPSPTGFLHLGALRTALYNFAFAQSQGGKFILRIEDTDRRRFVPGATKEIFETLQKFGLVWDEGPEVGGPFAPYIQSERTKLGIYKEYAEKLVKDGNAFYCFCQEQSKEEIEDEHEQKIIKLRDEECRNLTDQEIKEKLASGLKPAIRLRLPEKNEIVEYHDFIINQNTDKKIGWFTQDIDEIMLLKSDGFPTYHLAVVVDDALMQISHVLRGPEWLPSTPVHLLLMRYLGFPLPQIGHLTAILDPAGGKLSKRKGSVWCKEFLSEGYLPEAILNFIMLLGWAPKDNRELFTLKEFVEDFPKGNLQIANPIFNRQKLDWFNGVYIRKKTDEELVQLISRRSAFGGKPFTPEGASVDLIKQTIPLIKERIIKLSDYQDLAGFFFARPKLKKNFFQENAKNQLNRALLVLEENPSWTKEKIEEKLKAMIEKEGWQTGNFFMNLRLAITGSKITPPITDSIVLLGKEETLKRINDVLKKL